MAAGAPEGYNSASPYLIVGDADATIRFLLEAWAGTELSRYPRDDGRVMHSEVRIGDSVIMVADSADGWPPVGSHVHLYFADVDDAYRRALEAGATSVQEPVKKGDPDKRGGVMGPGGITWWIATHLG